jgi:restriction endonuclease Mrr
VARLRRGWIGVYVTTSYFSPRAQQEVIDDEYPLVLVHGRQLAEAVRQIMFERGITNVDKFLVDVDATYEERRAVRNPSEILFD